MTFDRAAWNRQSRVRAYNNERAKARLRAFKRLAELYPDDFRRLFDEEFPPELRSLTNYTEERN